MDASLSNLLKLQQALAAKQVNSTAATRWYLDRIEKHNPALGVYNEVYADRALERAALADAGKLTGPFAGVPIAIKDNLCTPYGHTTCSSKMLADFKAPYMATAVKALEDAGMVVLGKTNLDEFAMGSSTENSARGPSRNPWDINCVPGGSSGGSAAAVAADLAPAALGSDTGGSIRQPAALCGIVGLKPTYGRVSRWGLIAFASSLDQIGPMCHNVADTAALMDLISGHDPLDSTSANLPATSCVKELDQPVENLRIGLAKQYMSDANDPAVNAAVDQAVEIYKAAGAKIVQVDLPHTEYGIPTYYIVATAEASSNLARYDGVHYGHRAKDADNIVDLYSHSRAQGFGPEVKRRIMLGTYALSSGYYDAYYLRAQKVRRLIQQDFAGAFQQCDVILAPTTNAPAFRFGEKSDDPLAMYLNDVYTVNANLAGIPGVSLPAGLVERDGSQLPVAIQLFGPAFEEARLLRAAYQFEQATSHHQARPNV